MAKFSEFSKNNLKNAHPKLRKVLHEVIKNYDCRVLCSNRGEAEQNRLYNEGKSKLEFPDSKHNAEPSLAVDVVPYPIDWNDIDRFMHFGGYVSAVADSLGIKVRWGGDWDGDFDFNDQSFIDYPHFELI